jgi:hypothetical protein
VGGHLQLLGQLTIAKNLDFTVQVANQTGVRQLLEAHLGAIIESLKLRHIYNFAPFCEVEIAEASLGQPTKQGHLATLIQPYGGPSGPAACAFVSTAGSLSMAASRASAYAFASLLFACDRSNFVIQHLSNPTVN